MQLHPPTTAPRSLLTCPRRLLPTILRRRLFCPLALTSSSLSASQPAWWPPSAQQRSSQPPPSWRRQFSVPRPGPRRVESIRLTPVTWPNEIAFELRNLRTAPPIRQPVRPATPSGPQRSPIPPRPQRCDNSTHSPSPSRLEALLVATHGVLGDCVDIILPAWPCRVNFSSSPVQSQLGSANLAPLLRPPRKFLHPATTAKPRH